MPSRYPGHPIARPRDPFVFPSRPHLLLCSRDGDFCVGPWCAASGPSLPGFRRGLPTPPAPARTPPERPALLAGFQLYRPSFPSALLVTTVRRSSTPTGARRCSSPAHRYQEAATPVESEQPHPAGSGEPWVAARRLQATGGGATRLPPTSYHGKVDAWGGGTQQVKLLSLYTWLKILVALRS